MKAKLINILETAEAQLIQIGINDSNFKRWLSELSSMKLSEDFKFFLRNQAHYYQPKNRKYANFLFELGK